MFVNYNHPTVDLFDMQCFSFCLLLGFKGIFLRNKTKVKNLKDSFVTVFLLLSCLQQLQKKEKSNAWCSYSHGRRVIAEPVVTQC